MGRAQRAKIIYWLAEAELLRSQAELATADWLSNCWKVRKVVQGTDHLQGSSLDVTTDICERAAMWHYKAGVLVPFGCPTTGGELKSRAQQRAQGQDGHQRGRGCARVRTHVLGEVGVPLVAKGSAFVPLARRTRVHRLMGESGGATKQQFRTVRLKIGTAS
jgi:hypothetical protein